MLSEPTRLQTLTVAARPVSCHILDASPSVHSPPLSVVLLAFLVWFFLLDLRSP